MKRYLVVLVLIAILVPCVSATGGTDDGYTKLLMHFDSAVFTDESGKNVTNNGTNYITTSKVFGTGSAYFNNPAEGDFVSIEDSEDWNISAGDFTIDFWHLSNYVPENATYHYFVSQSIEGSSSQWIRYFNLSGTYYLDYTSWNGASIAALVQASSSSPILPVGSTWAHIAVVQENISYNDSVSNVTDSLYIDGNCFWSNHAQRPIPNIASNLTLGSYNETVIASYMYRGAIDELRISKGIARWSANFTPPTSEYRTSWDYTSAGTFYWLCPPGVTSITLEMDGGGGGDVA
jgi:hypothetical protein